MPRELRPGEARRCAEIPRPVPLGPGFAHTTSRFQTSRADGLARRPAPGRLPVGARCRSPRCDRASLCGLRIRPAGLTLQLSPCRELGGQPGPVPPPTRRGQPHRSGTDSEPGLGREDAAQGLWHVHHTFTSQPGARPDVACHPSSASAVPRPTQPHTRRAARPSESDSAPVRPRPPHHLPLQRVLLSSLPAPRAGTAGCYGDG